MNYNRKPSLFLVSILFVVGLGCSLSAPTQAPNILPPPPTPTPEICSENPAGLVVQVQFGGKDNQGQGIMLKGSGFTPDEKLTIRITGHGATHGFEIETKNYAANASGNFSISEVLPLDEPRMRVEVHVIHQRGIACLGFGIPQ